MGTERYAWPRPVRAILLAHVLREIGADKSGRFCFYSVFAGGVGRTWTGWWAGTVDARCDEDDVFRT